MRVVMRYGKEGLPLDLPDDLEITLIEKRAMPVLADPLAAIRGAFSDPVGSRTLREEARGKRSACILICDITRPAPNGAVLPVLIDELIKAGLSPSSITILVATGLHRPNLGDELLELVGDPALLSTVSVVNHFARSDEDHVHLGTTPSGMPVKLDRRFVGADLRIVVGLVEPHFMAGYSGGRKMIVPGVAHEETIRWIHSTRLLKHGKAANCVISGNPLHDEMMACLPMIGPCFAVNTVIDENRSISFVNFGEIGESHVRAVAWCRPYFEIPLDRRFRTVLTSSAGYPLDRTYYQTVKAMCGALDILEPGAHLFVVSECSEGLGSPEFARSQAGLISLGTDPFFSKSAASELASIDEWESIMQVKVMNAASIHLFSAGLRGNDRALTGVRMIDSVPEALTACVKEHKDRAVAVIPEGPYVIPFFKPGPSASEK